MMRLRVGAGVVRGVLLAAVGASPMIACGGSETNGEPAASGGSSSGGGGGGSGGDDTRYSGGANPGGAGGAGGLVTGGTTPAGGAGGALPTGGAGGTGGPYVCRNPKPAAPPNIGTVPGFVLCDDGVIQRDPTVACTNGIVPTEGPYIPESMQDVGCRTHADCTERPYGHCTTDTGTGFGIATRSYCTYGCLGDTDCQGGGLCVCGTGPVGTCYQGCSSNDECSEGEPCAFITYTSGCGNVHKLQCGVDCRADTDCEQGRCVNGGCQYSVPCGRPFLVEGTARLAPPAIRSDWAEAAAPETEHLSADVRAALATHWTELGLMEHASVAAFARFTLQLLSLGAPSSLVQSASDALADETEHARLCFGIASAYARRKVGPGALPVERALSGDSFAEVVRTAFLEACVGETTAALEAAECAARAADPAIAAALRRIAADETRHAELGWKFVTWALETADGVTRRALLRELSAVAVAPATDLLDAGEEALLPHGVASRSLRAAVRDAALRDVVQPCLATLIARFEPDTRRSMIRAAEATV